METMGNMLIAGILLAVFIWIGGRYKRGPEIVYWTLIAIPATPLVIFGAMADDGTQRVLAFTLAGVYGVVMYLFTRIMLK